MYFQSIYISIYYGATNRLLRISSCRKHFKANWNSQTHTYLAWIVIRFAFYEIDHFMTLIIIYFIYHDLNALCSQFSSRYL